MYTNQTDQHESKHVLGHGGQDQGTGLNKDTENSGQRQETQDPVKRDQENPKKDRDVRMHQGQGESAGRSCPNSEGHNIRRSEGRLCYILLMAALDVIYSACSA